MRYLNLFQIFLKKFPIGDNALSLMVFGNPLTPFPTVDTVFDAPFPTVDAAFDAPFPTFDAV